MPNLLSPNTPFWKVILQNQSLQAAGVSKDISFDFQSYNAYLLEFYVDAVGAAGDVALEITALLASGVTGETCHYLNISDTTVTAVENEACHARSLLRRGGEGAIPTGFEGWGWVLYRRPFSSYVRTFQTEFLISTADSTTAANSRLSQGRGKIISASNNFTGLRFTLPASTTIGNDSYCNVYASEDFRNLS